MFKLSLFALLALAAIAHAEVVTETMSELAIVPTDDEEVKYLKEENKMFADYCIKSRDATKSFLAQAANDRLASIFEVIFSSVNDAGNEVFQAQDKTIDESAQKIGDLSEDKTLVQLMIEGAKAVLRALFDTAKSQLFQRIELLKTQFPAGTVREEIEDACKSISYKLKSKVDDHFVQARNAMRASATKMGAEGAPLLEQISKARFDNIGCLTVGRVSKVQKFCDILNVAGDSVWSLLGM